MTQKYKCYKCSTIVLERPCPVCGNDDDGYIKPMCELDHCNCIHEISNTIAYCPKCGEPVCPECMCHDVMQISRVTGYLQSVAGWNSAKQQELKDRKRYDI